MPRRFKKDKKDKKERKRFSIRKKACRFCVDKEMAIDYKLVKLLSQFVTEAGKIVPRRLTGNCAFHQRQVVESVQRARVLVLLPYCMSHTSL